jgi:hypothetical protein
MIEIVDDCRSATRLHVGEAKGYSACSHHDPPLIQAAARRKTVLGEVERKRFSESDVISVHWTSFGPTLRRAF